MRRLGLVLEYDGTAYAGWQRQPAAPTVQAAVEDAATTLLGAPCRVVGAGRTDAGVHALGQVAHLSTVSRLPADRVRAGLTALLPGDIVVREVFEAPAAFHARRDARLRVYAYVILARARPSALLRRYTHHVPEPLDLDAMRDAAEALVGEHDFAAYRVTGTPTATTVCTVAALTLDRRGDLLIITIAADRFLRQMVRRVVGTLLKVGTGAWPRERVAAALRSGDSRQAAAPAPACGLYLARVVY